MILGAKLELESLFIATLPFEFDCDDCNYFPCNSNKYEFGRCKKCFKNNKPLKNGYCIDCEKLPDIIKDLFDGFDKYEKI